jgi:hypothetical protein
LIPLYKACQYVIKQLPELLVSLEYQQNNRQGKEPKNQRTQKTKKHKNQKKQKNKDFQRYFKKV